MQKIILYFSNKLNKIDNPFLITIFRHSPKYFSASFISALVGMLMTKYYTFVFSPIEFGILSLYLMLFNYLQNFIALSVDSSYQRVYFDYKGKERAQLLGTVLIFMTVSAFSVSVIAFFAKNIVVRNFGGTSLMYYSTIILTIIFMYFNFLNRISYNEQSSNLIFQQGLLQTFLNHFGSFILIVYARLGILGRQLGQLIAYTINVIFYAKNLKRAGLLESELIFRTDMFRRLWFFAFPAFSTTVLAASFSYLDRIFLNYYHGAKEVGIYSLGFTIGQGISIIVEAVSMAIFPSLMVQLEQDYKNNIKKLKHFDILFCCILVLIGIVVFFLRDVIIQILSNRNYENSAQVLPFIVFGFVIGGFYKTVSSVLSFHSVVWFYPVLSIVSFASAAAVNYFLIPNYGEVGAAYAYFVGIFIYSLILHIIGSRYFYRLYKVILVYSVFFVIITSLFLQFIM